MQIQVDFGSGKGVFSRMAHAGKPIDMAHLDAVTFQDPELKKDVLELFLSHSTALRKFLTDEASCAGHILHTLKGSARGIGAWHLAETLENAETALMTGDTPDLVTVLDALGDVQACIQETLG